MTVGAKDRHGQIFATIVGVIALLSAFAVLSLRAPVPVVQPTLSLSGLDSLAPFLTPFRDTATLAAQVAPTTILVVRDPFATVNAPRESAPRTEAVAEVRIQKQAPDSEWVVYGILIAGNNRSAFINETLVKLGATFDGGARLTAVEPSYVVLTDAEGKRHTLAVPKGGDR